MTTAPNNTPANAPDLSARTHAELCAMAAAGARAAECVRVLNRVKANPVSEILRGQGEFYQWDHYPKGDVYDAATGAQYYYHAHPPEARGDDVYGGEHGHFHTFMRPQGAKSGAKGGAAGAAAHLIAVSMDRAGAPIRLFTTNRWVTGETWRPAAEMRRLLNDFNVDTPHPSWPANIWITSMAALFRPVIETLLDERDAAAAAWAQKHGCAPEDVFEDRRLEVTSAADISFTAHTAAVNAALKAKTRACPV